MRQLKSLPLEEFVLFDIETASAAEHLEEMPEAMQEIWKEREEKRGSDEDPADRFEERAGIEAEFGRVVAISVGIFTRQKEGLALRVQSIAYPEEEFILQDFVNLLNRFAGNNDRYSYLCGHNIKGFDIPYLCKRLIHLGMELPNMLDLADKKPWEIPHLDTMELWRFGDRRSYVSLKLLCAFLGIPSPKQDIDGSEVSRVFWKENDLDRIAEYCSRDVSAVGQLILRLRGEKLLDEDQIVFV
jgi:uncharacterized protein YprB with RNaseH-like and TPR domain